MLCPVVVIESPFAGDVERNKQFAADCMKESLGRGEYPTASHLLYTAKGILDDTVPDERATGIHAGFAWAAKADLTAVYVNLGISSGMLQGIANAKIHSRPVFLRYLRGDKWPRPNIADIIDAVSGSGSMLVTVLASEH